MKGSEEPFNFIFDKINPKLFLLALVVSLGEKQATNNKYMGISYSNSLSCMLRSLPLESKDGWQRSFTLLISKLCIENGILSGKVMFSFLQSFSCSCARHVSLTN